MSTALTLAPRDDPALLGWPATLPIEIALRIAPLKEICAAYELSREDLEALKANPRFIEDVAAAVELVKKEGMSFKLKARLQSDALLETSWNVIHDPLVPAAVRADLIKYTWRVAGLDASKEQANAANQNNLQININL